MLGRLPHRRCPRLRKSLRHRRCIRSIPPVPSSAAARRGGDPATGCGGIPARGRNFVRLGTNRGARKSVGEMDDYARAYGELSDRLVAAAWLIVRDAELAADVTAEAFAKVYPRWR